MFFKCVFNIKIFASFTLFFSLGGGKLGGGGGTLYFAQTEDKSIVLEAVKDDHALQWDRQADRHAQVQWVEYTALSAGWLPLAFKTILRVFNPDNGLNT